MLKNLVYICVILVLNGCASSETPNNDISASGTTSITENIYHWVSLPRPDSLVIYGVSGRQVRRDMEIDIAREHAARIIALYHGVFVTYDTIQHTGSGFLDFFADSTLTLDYDRAIEKYIDRLTFDPERDVIFIDNAVFVRFTYPAVFPARLNHAPQPNRNGRPEWTNRPPPMMGDFYTGVGFSGRQVRMKDTITQSYESAMVSIASQISSVISTSDTTAGYQTQTTVHRRSQGQLSHFTVLELWIDPESLAVWTLAVARNAR